MATVGLLVTPQLTVDPFDVDTVAQLSLRDPDDEVIALSLSNDGAGAYSAATISLGAPGEWHLLWTVTGTGWGQTDQKIVVEPEAGYTPTGFSFATTGDLAKAPGRMPDDAVRLLLDATAEITRATKLAVYATDARGYAVNPAIRAALRDATVELALWWDETGTYSGSRQLITSAAIAGVSLSYGGMSSTNAQANRIGPAVWSILIGAGLIGGGPLNYA